LSVGQDTGYWLPHVQITKLDVLFFSGSDSARTMFSKATFWICQRLKKHWFSNLNVCLAALEALGGLSQIRLPDFCESKKEGIKFVLVLVIDYRCDNRHFRLSIHNCQVPIPTSQKLEVEQQIRIFRAG
jgi:hypothetical protein